MKRNDTRMGRRWTCQAFTITEIMVVLIVIGLILGLVGPAIIGNLEKGKQKATQAQIKLLSVVIDNYYLDNRAYPRSLDDLVRNPGLDTWKSTYLNNATEVPKDGWKNPFEYDVPGRNGQPYEVYSLGRDRAPGGDGYDQDIHVDTEL